MDFNSFKKNPVTSLAFLLVAGISILYIDLRSNMQDQIENLQEQVAILKV